MSGTRPAKTSGAGDADTPANQSEANMSEDKPEGQQELKVPCDVYSRVVGYLTLVQNWNIGKKQEYEDRKVFILKTKRSDE